MVNFEILGSIPLFTFFFVQLTDGGESGIKYRTLRLLMVRGNSFKNLKRGTVVTKTGPWVFTAREPEKLKDIKAGDNVKLTIQEDGSMVIEKAK